MLYFITCYICISGKFHSRVAILVAVAFAIYLLALGIIDGLFVLTIGRMGTQFDAEGFQGQINLENLKVFKMNADVCSANPVKILFCVKSSIRNFKKRHVLRNTWLSPIKISKKYKFVFVLGRPQYTHTQISKFLSYEMNTFQDVVQGNFIDSYHNITLKSIFILSWARRYCPQAENVMSVDDDTFVNLENLERFLMSKARRTNLLAGYVLENKKPFRSKFSKWYASYKSYPGGMYPRFAMGAGY